MEGLHTQTHAHTLSLICQIECPAASPTASQSTQHTATRNTTHNCTCTLTHTCSTLVPRCCCGMRTILAQLDTAQRCARNRCMLLSQLCCLLGCISSSSGCSSDPRLPLAAERCCQAGMPGQPGSCFFVPHQAVPNTTISAQQSAGAAV